MPIKILHLSDAHVSTKNQLEIRTRIAALTKATESADLILFSGDCTRSGSETEAKLFIELIANELCQTLGVAPERFVVVPGNHDVCRDRVTKITGKGIRASVENPDEVDAIWTEEAGKLKDHLIHWHTALNASQHTTSSRKFQFAEASIGVACINSAWASHSDGERHLLAIGVAQFTAELAAIETADIKIGLWHHPLDWLTDADAQRLRVRAQASLDLCCMGHIHTDQFDSSASFSGATKFVQAPAILARHKDALNGFMEYEISDRKLTARCFAFDERGGKYVPHGAFGQGGVWTTDLPEKDSRDAKLVRARAKAIANILNALQKTLAASLPLGSFSELNVQQRILDPLISENGTPRTLSGIAHSTEPQLIFGHQHSGKTTALQGIVLNLCASDVLCIQITWDEVPKQSPDSRDLIRLLSTHTSLSDRDVRQALKLPTAITIDNIGEPSDTRWEVIKSWLAAFPQLRLFGAGNKQIIPDGIEFPKQWRQCTLQPMSVTKIRTELTRLLSGEPAPDLETVIDILVDAELPRWPWSVAIFAELARDKSFTQDISSLPLLLEVFIQSRLGKLGITPENRRVLDGILRHTAETLTERNVSQIPRDEFIEVIQTRLTTSGVTEDAHLILKQLLASRLLVHESGRLSFSFFVLQEYLCAASYHERLWNDFSELDASTLIKRGGVLAFYAYLIRSEKLLERAFEIAKLRVQNDEILSIEALDGSLLDVNDEPDGMINVARASVLSEPELERAVSEREKSNAGRRMGRLNWVEPEDSEDPTALLRTLVIAVQILRANMWAPKEQKRQFVRQATELTLNVATLITNNKGLMQLILAKFKSDENKVAIAKMLNVVFVSIVSALVADEAGASHLSSAIRDQIDAEDSELHLAFLLVWFVESGGGDVVDVFDSALPKVRSHSILRVLELCVLGRYVTGASFGSAKRPEQEELLRRIARARMPNVLDDRQAKNEAERIVQDARKQRQRHAMDTSSHS